eukprot:scaffold241701_cov30-Tisochrysis_lutea.AAC.1
MTGKAEQQTISTTAHTECRIQEHQQLHTRSKIRRRSTHSHNMSTNRHVVQADAHTARRLIQHQWLPFLSREEDVKN